MRERILTAGPHVGEKEVEYVMDAVKHGWNTQWNTYIVRFEEAFAKEIGVKHALSTSSCTGALHLALASLNIGPGDEVIVPDLTWIATASAVKYVGATPVFAEIDPTYWTMDPRKGDPSGLESLINEHTKAIIPVHLYGHPAEMDGIMEIARDHNLSVVEDAAPSIGATYKGKPTGSFGDFSAFSFQGAKLLVTGEGGMLLTDDTDLYERAKQLNEHGRGRLPGDGDQAATFAITELGYKYKMSNMQAAFGLAQLEKVDYLVDCKRQVFDWYQKRLQDVEGVSLNHEDSEGGARSIYWMTSLLLDPATAPVSRDEMMKRLDADYNVDSRPVFPQVSSSPIFTTTSPSGTVYNPVAEFVSKNALNLPSGVCLEEEDVDYVCNSIHSILDSK